MRFSNAKEFTKENISEEEEEASGAYIFLDKNGNEIYIGVSEDIQERLEAAYYGRADYNQVKRKKTLRRRIREYKTCYTTIERARSLEHSKKEEMRFNQL